MQSYLAKNKIKWGQGHKTSYKSETVSDGVKEIKNYLNLQKMT